MQNVVSFKPVLAYKQATIERTTMQQAAGAANLLDQLHSCLKAVDLLGFAMAGAYLELAINCVQEETGGADSAAPRGVALAQKDFSWLDSMIDELPLFN